MAARAACPTASRATQAWKQLVEFSRRAAEQAKPYGIVVTIEPLRKEETNIVNTAAEGLDLVTAVNHANFQLMIDFYHLASEHEDPAIVLESEGSPAPPARRQSATAACFRRRGMNTTTPRFSPA